MGLPPHTYAHEPYNPEKAGRSKAFAANLCHEGTLAIPSASIVGGMKKIRWFR